MIQNSYLSMTALFALHVLSPHVNGDSLFTLPYLRQLHNEFHHSPSLGEDGVVARKLLTTYFGIQFDSSKRHALISVYKAHWKQINGIHSAE